MLNRFNKKVESLKNKLEKNPQETFENIKNVFDLTKSADEERKLQKVSKIRKIL